VFGILVEGEAGLNACKESKGKNKQKRKRMKISTVYQQTFKNLFSPSPLNGDDITIITSILNGDDITITTCQRARTYAHL